MITSYDVVITSSLSICDHLRSAILNFLKLQESAEIELNVTNTVFSHDVTAAMLVSQNKEMAAMLVSQTKPLGIELYFCANTFFSFSKPIWLVVR